ncbi:MAG: hypothetical protein JWM44_2140 [Bacilli bacterium]|jgi:hypothetical protein|nr:hypothetical protein [Bacilli bacterium]
MDNKNLTAVHKFGRLVFAFLALIFAACIIVQVFLAGLAVFVNKDDWGPHTSFIHVFEFVPILMFAVSFIGRVPSRIRWNSLGLFIMIILQYITAKALSGMWLAALHPVIAIFLFWNALTIVKQSWRWILAKENINE